MKKFIIGLSAILSSSAIAGGSMGGGTPPALQDLQQDLLMTPSLDGGLFDRGNDVGLLTRIKLQPQLTVSSGSIGGGNPPALEFDGGSSGGGTPPALRLSEADLAVLRNRIKPLDATTVDGGNVSYNIEAADTLDSVILKDRRLKMRESISN